MKRHRVVIDGYNMSMPAGTGIATYGRGLVAAARSLEYDVDILLGPSRTPGTATGPKAILNRQIFSAVGSMGRAVRYFTAAPQRLTAMPLTPEGLVDADLNGRLPTHHRTWAIPDLFRLAEIHYRISGKFLEVTIPDAPDFVHWTYTMPIRAVGALNIYTIHDLVPFIMPESVQINRNTFAGTIREIALKADHILTVSEKSKHDILQILGVPADRVSNTYQTIDLPSVAVEKPIDQVREEIESIRGLPFGEYFLFFGAIEPKKNVNGLIHGYLKSRIDNPLVIVGKFAWDFEREATMLSDPKLGYVARSRGVLEASHGLKYFEYMQRDSLVSLIRGAKAVLFPAFYEGFGLPAAEAMSLGIPVMASTKGALPEICGDAALLVDPYDIEAIAEGIRLLGTDHNLRYTLSKRGEKRAARFTLSSYASRMEDIYQYITERKPP